MSIAFHEMRGYPIEERTLLNFSATRKLLCAWNDRTALRELLIGHPGQLYPYAYSFGARVVEVSIEPFGKEHQDALGEDLAWYEAAVLTVKYRSPGIAEPQPYPEEKSPSAHNNPQAVISENLEPYAQGMRLSPEKFRWSDGTALSEEEAPPRILYRAKYTMTRYNLPAVPEEAVTYVGKINDAPVWPILLSRSGNPAGDLYFPTNTLLFQPPTISMSMDSAGTRNFSVAYKFAFREEGWRKFWRADNEAYETIHHVASDGGAGAEYEMPEEADFSVLFPDA